MSRGLRRTLSWLLVLVLIAAAFIAWQFVPGSGGLEEELRWLLARDYVPPGHFNRATELILAAEQQREGTRRDLFEQLLLANDRRVVRGALRLLYDHMHLHETGGEDLRAAFVAWLQHASLGEKIQHKRLALMIAAQGPVVRNWVLPLRKEDQRWVVAGTLEPANHAGVLADFLTLSPDPQGKVYADRLAFVDDGRGRSAHDVTSDILDMSGYGAYERPTRAELVAMLDDPICEVRWGAGRILAVAGDARGMPAFCEWLAQNPRRTRAANELMTGLYGANWRDLCESGSAASQAGAGDGGG